MQFALGDVSRRSNRVASAISAETPAPRLLAYEKIRILRVPLCDAVNLFWFGDGIEGRNVGMSEYTFKRGLRELIGKGFLRPKDSASFWTNPALFFKGERVMFIKEYRRRVTAADQTHREELERRGQQRIEETS